MSTGTVTPPAMPQTLAPPTELEVVIDQRLRQTRRQVKTVDVASRLVGLAIAVIAYLLAASLTDHWLVSGGLATWERVALWLGLVAGALTYLGLLLLPPMLHRINPLFAAETIEKSEHTLKNSLINFLLLRGRREEVAGPFYRAMESRAAADLTKVKIEVAVDRTRLLHLVWALAIAVALFVVYLLVSPKSPLSSAARILFPWSNIEAPTRVTIRDVQPGDKTLFHGDSLDVSAVVDGLRTNEPLLLVYSTADGQIVDQTIAMEPSKDGLHYRCHFPPGNLGFQQDCVYFLAGGDCRTPRFHVRVETAPAVAVDSVTFHYPAYVERPDRTVKQDGNLNAIDGTEVTIHATANTEIRPGSAEIDLNCTGDRGVDMTAHGRTASGAFTLSLKEGDRSRPKYHCYQVRFENAAGQQNPQPVRYQIDVIPDLPPEVQLVDPPANETAVAENGSLPIRVRAKDPDFALRSVTLRAEHGGHSLSIPPLLEKRSPAKPLTGEFQGTYSFQPAKLGLKAGDRVEYSAEAEDNREPDANRSTTEKHSFLVVAPGAQPPQDKQEKQDQPNADKSNQSQSDQKQSSKNDNKPGEEKAANDNQDQTGRNNDQKAGENNEKDGGKNGEKENGKPNKGDKGGEQQQKSDQSAEQRNERTPLDDPGDAIDKILKDREQEQEQKKQQGNDQKHTEKNDTDKGENKQQGGDQNQKSEPQKADSQQGGGNQKQENQSGNAQKSDSQQGGGNQKQENQSGNAQKSDSQQGGGNQKQENQSGNAQKSDSQQGGGNQKQENQSGNAQKSDSQQGGGNQKQENQNGNAQKSDSQQGGGNQKQENQSGNAQKSDSQQGGGNQKQENQSGNAQKSDSQQGGGNQKQENQNGNAQKSDSQQGGGNQKQENQNGNAQKSDSQQGGGNQKQENQSGNAQKSDSQQGNADQHGSPQKTESHSGDGEKGNPDQKSDGQSGDSHKAEDLKGDGHRQAGSQQPNPRKSDKEQGAAGGNTDSHTADAKTDQEQPTEPAGGTPDQKQSPGAGRDSGGGASPKPEGINQQRAKTLGEVGKANDKPHGSEPQAASKSDHQSDSRGETNGDKSGGGKTGGGQQANNQGVGNAGSHTAADDGGAKANQQGNGEVGQKAGQNAASKTPTGSQAAADGGGAKSEQAPNANASPQAGAASQNPADAGKQGGETAENGGNPGPDNSNPGGGSGTLKGSADNAERAPCPPTRPTSTTPADRPNWPWSISAISWPKRSPACSTASVGQRRRPSISSTDGRR